MNTTRVDLQDVIFHDGETTIGYCTTDDDGFAPKLGGGTDTGRLVVRVNIDADPDHCSVHLDSERSTDLTVIRRSIATLQRLEEHLVLLDGDNPPLGHCMGHSDRGRCVRTERHEGAHASLTEVYDARKTAEQAETASA